MARTLDRVEFGDWQTPRELTERVVKAIADRGLPAPGTIIEPTCGEGSFLQSAIRQWPRAKVRGFEINPKYVERARSVLGSHHRDCVVAGDFFETKWELVIEESEGPVLFLGNPPWVTSSALGAIGGENLPAKTNFKGLNGLDAITGKGNFDVSEWMLVRLLTASLSAGCTIAMLIKSSVARKLLEYCASRQLDVQGEVVSIDAQRYFDAAVDAVLFIMRVSPGRRSESDLAWTVYSGLESGTPSSQIGVVDGVLVSDIVGYLRTRHLAGPDGPEWRSGLKHDCARVMEFDVREAGLQNGLDERVTIEPDLVFPLLKGSDVANGRLYSRRRVLVPQRTLGQNTGFLAREYPETWAYLTRHRDALDSRKSSIYNGQPPYSVFGVGDYTFSPWKVAICGLYKRLAFQIIGPQDGKPVVVDDTCYFIPCDDEAEARRMLGIYDSELARCYFESRIFWDSKRPINKSILRSLDPFKVAAGLGQEVAWGHSRAAQMSLVLEDDIR